MRSEALGHGDIVEVKSATEILATLDDQGALAALPFMPEMLQHCGRRFAVDKRAEKVCDTISAPSTGSRRLPDTVLLGDLRCDGSAHGGCQAECRLYWKEEWLHRVEGGQRTTPEALDERRVTLERLVNRSAAKTVEMDGKAKSMYRCQATELVRASGHLRVWDPRPYLREYTCGNVPLDRFLRITARAAIQEPLRKLGLVSRVHLKGPGTPAAPEPPLALEPGEWVQVKTRDEIARTLNPKGRHRGLWFDREMLPHCGRTYRVRGRVTRIVDERTGFMLEMKNDCVTLEGTACSGDLSHGRWFCPRQIYPYWREIWLRRVDPSTEPRSGGCTDQPAEGARI